MNLRIYLEKKEISAKKAKAAHTTAVTALNKLKKEANGIAQKSNKAKKDALKAKGLAEKNKKGEESAIKATNVAAGAVEAAIVVEETAKRNADEIVAKAEKMRQELGLGELFVQQLPQLGGLDELGMI